MIDIDQDAWNSQWEIVYLGDDWVGIYHNGLLLCEGHSISASELLRVMTGEYPPTRNVQDENLMSLPEKLEDL